MNAKLRVEATVHFGRGRCSENVVRPGEAPEEPRAGRVPRISRMMALAVWFDELIRKGEVKNFAELARLGQVSPTRVSQIMNLLLLSPDIQKSCLSCRKSSAAGNQFRSTNSARLPPCRIGGSRGIFGVSCNSNWCMALGPRLK